MDKIRKVINIGQFLNKFGHTNAFSVDWGELAYDYYVGESYSEFLQNLVTFIRESGTYENTGWCNESEESGVTEYYIIRRGTILRAMRVINSMFNEGSLYRLCRRKGLKLVPENDFDYFGISGDTLDVSVNDFYFSNSLPSISSECVVINDDSYSNVDEEGGMIECNESSFTENYIDVLNNVNGEIVTERRYIVESSSTIDNGMSIGDYVLVHPNVDEFLRLFGGEGELTTIERAVMFFLWASDDPDKRTMSEESEDAYPPYLELHIPLTQDVNEFGTLETLVEDWVPGKKYGTNDEAKYNGEIYYLGPGYETEWYSGIIPPPDDGNWLQSSVTYNTGCGEEGSVITGYTDSKLISLRTLKKSYDKDGNVLPFIEKVTTNEYGEITNIEVGENGGIPYQKDIPLNISIDGDIIKYDKITEITILYKHVFIDEDSGETITWSTGDNFDELDEDCVGGIILFTYYCGNITENQEDFSENNGICYREYYCFDIKAENFILDIDEEETEYKYISIDYERDLDADESETLDLEYMSEGVENMIELRAYSAPSSAKLYTRFESETDENNMTQDAHYIFRDDLIGYHEVNINAKNVKIERGKYAAFERHNALGEVSSFDDLEKYKNGFFKLKDNENY